MHKVGHWRSFAIFIVFCITLGIAIDSHSKALDSYIAISYALIIVAGFLYALWKRWSGPMTSQRTGLITEVSILPPRVRRWVLGEDDNEQVK